MINFTKKNLELMQDIVRAHMNDYPTITNDDLALYKKIQYMIDNYCRDDDKEDCYDVCDSRGTQSIWWWLGDCGLIITIRKEKPGEDLILELTDTQGLFKIEFPADKVFQEWLSNRIDKPQRRSRVL